MTNSRVHGLGLERLRRLRGLDVDDAAAAAGVPVHRWIVWEWGEDWPTEGQVRRVFGVSRETVMRLGAAEPENR